MNLRSSVFLVTLPTSHLHAANRHVPHLFAKVPSVLGMFFPLPFGPNFATSLISIKSVSTLVFSEAVFFDGLALDLHALLDTLG